MSGDDDASGLRRGLGLLGAVSIVVGTVIGTGIFLKTALMAQLLGSAGWVLAAWVVAGLLSLAGTFTYAELATMMPQAGGPYVYLKAAYGKLPAFFFGWKELLSTKGASNAAVSMAIAIFLTQLVPLRVVWAQRTFHLFHESVTWQFGSLQVEAIAVIIILSAVNCLGVRAGGAAQTLLTAAKLLGIAFLVVGAFTFSHGSWRHFGEEAYVGTTRTAGLSAFGAAMIAALWAYSGWGDLIIAAGEVRQPGRTIPRGLIAGIGIIIIVYAVTNAAYMFALPLSQVASANSTAFPNAPPVAARVAAAFLGAGGAAFLSLLFVVSALGTLNGGILTGSRIPFAMAQDGQMPAALAALHPQTRAPVSAIVFLGAWACLLTVTGTFDQLTTLIIFVDILLDAIGVVAIFILRRSMAGAQRPYRTPLYPWVPALYVATLVWLIANTVWTNPLEVAGGLGLLVAGVPVYLYFRAKDRRRPELVGPAPTAV